MRTTHCIACNKELTNRRPQTKTCNAACRARHWRHSRITMIPEKIMFSITNHVLITKAASVAGVSFNKFVVDRIVQSEYSQC